MIKRITIFVLLCSACWAVDIPVFDGEDVISFEPVFDAPAVTEVRKDDALRVLIILDSPPDVNWWAYQIEDGGQFDYFYQKAPDDARTVVKDGGEYLRWYDVEWDDWPERSVRMDKSWAVYHKYKKGDYTALGGINYGAGKAFHIVADAWDSAGEHIKPDIWIQHGVYTVCVDTQWLDCAEYPVVINDTFGYGGVPGTSTTATAARIYGHGPYSPASNGSATSASLYCVNAAKQATLGIYSDSSGPANILKDGAGITPPGVIAYTDDTFDSSLAVASATSYWPAFNSDGCGVAYDSGTGVDTYYKDQTYVHGTLSNITSPTLVSGRRYGLYVTYTPSGGGTSQSVFTYLRRRR